MEPSTTPLVDGPRSVQANQGVVWWTDAWALFMKNPGMWVVLGLILLILTIVSGVLPFVGGLVTALLWPVFMGGWLLAVHQQQQGSAIEPGDLFAGFKAPHLNPLLVIGALSLAAFVVIMLVLGVVGFGAALGMGVGGAMRSGSGMAAAAGMGLVGMLLCLALTVPVSMALWFAPALVLWKGLAPVDALKASFNACLRNLVPFLVFGLLWFVAAIVASMLFGLGWLLLLPVGMLTLYTSYHDVFA